MAMGNGSRINTNILSLNAYNALNQITQQQGIHQLRLATGKRINSVGDDASGYTIVKQMEARSRVYAASLNNVGDAKSLLSTADGALQAVRDLLIQAQEKIAGANNPTADKNAIARDISQLGLEIHDIIGNTNFNGLNLFTSAFSEKFQVGYASSEFANVDFNAAALDTANVLMGMTASSFGGTYLTNAEIANDGLLSTTIISNDTDIAGALGAGVNKFSITVAGSTVPITVPVTGMETNKVLLTKMQNAINANAKAGVRASVSTYGWTSRLILTSKNSGSANTISLADVTGQLMEAAGISSTVVSDRASSDSTSAGYTHPWANFLDGYPVTLFSMSPVAGQASGAHSLLLKTLANEDELVTSDILSTNTDIAAGQGPGVFRFDVTVNGSAERIKVTLDGSETNDAVLTKVKDAVNADAAVGVTASTATDGTVSTLTFTAKNTGSNDAISIADVTGTVMDAAGITSAVVSARTRSGFGAAGYTTTYASSLNSTFEIDGTPMERTSNTVDDALTGVTMRLFRPQITSGASTLNLGLEYVSHSMDTLTRSAEASLQKIGSLIQRFDVKETNLSTAITNIEMSKSRIVDADVAFEQIKVTKLNILQQMGVAQLTQANNSPQQFLQLFKN